MVLCTLGCFRSILVVEGIGRTWYGSANHSQRIVASARREISMIIRQRFLDGFFGDPISDFGVWTRMPLIWCLAPVPLSKASVGAQPNGQQPAERNESNGPCWRLQGLEKSRWGKGGKVWENTKATLAVASSLVKLTGGRTGTPGPGWVSGQRCTGQGTGGSGSNSKTAQRPVRLTIRAGGRAFVGRRTRSKQPKRIVEAQHSGAGPIGRPH